MFRIRKVLDAVSSGNRDTIAQIKSIIASQFPTARPIDFEKISQQLTDPLHFRYKSVLLVAENSRGKVLGFSMALHFTDINIMYLELISTAPGITSNGIGSALYERVREEATLLSTEGVYFECSVDDPEVVIDEQTLGQNRARLRFYESYGARPIIHNNYASPVKPGDRDLYYLVFDTMGMEIAVPKKRIQKIVTAILDRKYRDIMTPEAIKAVAKSFTDPEIELRPYLYRKSKKKVKLIERKSPIKLIVNEGHEIHHILDKGYVEAPVRVSRILREIEKSGLFERVSAKAVPDFLLKEVHNPHFVKYLKRACTDLPEGKSIYPIIFPLRNLQRPPKDFELELGYYCMDSFTPLNSNAYKAARGAVECAYSGAQWLLNGSKFCYALVRPPGHHAESHFFGGFCYFNSSAVAAHFLSKYGKVAVLDLDYHHGNGTQNIFYKRADVLTVSIHGEPPTVYPHFAGFADEKGSGDGIGFNYNLPLPVEITPLVYMKTLEKAVKRIRHFAPDFLVIALGLDTAKADPTGTWTLQAQDFHDVGKCVGALKLPTLIVQEGGYRTRTIGINARSFFEGLVE